LLACLLAFLLPTTSLESRSTRAGQGPSSSEHTLYSFQLAGPDTVYFTASLATISANCPIDPFASRLGSSPGASKGIGPNRAVRVQWKPSGVDRSSSGFSRLADYFPVCPETQLQLSEEPGWSCPSSEWKDTSSGGTLTTLSLEEIIVLFSSWERHPVKTSGQKTAQFLLNRIVPASLASPAHPGFHSRGPSLLSPGYGFPSSISRRQFTWLRQQIGATLQVRNIAECMITRSV